MEKQRRIKMLSLSAVIVAVLGLTVAFAALSTTLNIKGSAYLDAAKWGIKFQNLSEPSIVGEASDAKTAKIEKDVSINDIKVTLSKPGDSVTYTVDLVNDGDINAKIENIEKTNLTEEQQKYITFTVKYKEDDTELKIGDILSKKEVKPLVIKIEYRKDLESSDLPKSAQEINLSYKLDFVQTDEEDEKLIGTTSTLAAGTNDKATGTFFNGNIAKNKIESITFYSTTDVPTDSIDSWDASLNKDGSVIAYYKDDDKNDLYELYIGAQGGVKAPSDSSSLFSYFTNLKRIDFGSSFNTYNVVNMKSMFNNCTSLTNLNLSGFNTINVTNMYCMFSYLTSLTSLDLSNFNTSRVTSMTGMFQACSKLTYLNLTNFNTSKVSNMSYMFNKCSTLTGLDLSSFDTSKVINMSYMFYNCTSLINLDLSSFDTPKVTNMKTMFANCKSLKKLNISNFDTENVTNMSYMFQQCLSLTNLDLSSFNTNNVTSMKSMFIMCEALTSLDLSNFNTSNVTDMSYMFYECNSLTSLDLSSFNTINVENMNAMFSHCTSMVSLNISGFNTKNVKNMNAMFSQCTSMVSLNVSGFNTSNVEDIQSMFYHCTSLINLDLSNWNVSKVTSLYSTFDMCSSLKSLNLNNWNTTKITSIRTAFYGCSSLSELDLSSFDFSNVTDYTENSFYNVTVPIYVKNDKSKEFLLSKNSSLNVIVK